MLILPLCYSWGVRPKSPCGRRSRRRGSCGGVLPSVRVGNVLILVPIGIIKRVDDKSALMLQIDFCAVFAIMLHKLRAAPNASLFVHTSTNGW